MKPPSRRRSAPARYRLGPSVNLWTDREKRRLLQGLRAHGQGPLQLELLKKYLPSKEEAEISSYVHQLKERVAREAVREQYQLQQRSRQIPAPIEVWTELAEKLTGCLGDAVTAAFSQVLTVAAAEPLNLLHSVPSKPMMTNSRCSSPAPHTENRKSNEGPQEETLPSDTEVAPADNDAFTVDFEKIYKYLSAISRGAKAPELPPGESAVLLDLIFSLPEELSFLDFKRLESHAHKCYVKLTTHYSEEITRMQEASWPASSGEELNVFPCVHSTSHIPEDKEGTSSSEAPRGSKTPTSATDWKSLGICPLNSFLFPLDMLARKEENMV
uniref:snRNA-activating protein complex subunit 2 n=1 Tax=Salvator merianae TaxID=96440 RepID=A0A8D0DY60_SALMN